MGMKSMPLLESTDDFARIMEIISDSAKSNLAFEYELEMDRLENLLDQNDMLLDSLEESVNGLQ